jgi:hypothetical protein
MISCKQCHSDLSPEEKDDILVSLAEGIKPDVLCRDCQEAKYDDDSDDDEWDCGICSGIGEHDLMCPNNREPFARLMQDGYD